MDLGAVRNGDGFEAARLGWAALHPGAPPPLDVVARFALPAADCSSRTRRRACTQTGSDRQSDRTRAHLHGFGR
eukprot:3261711-Prymnesium_polylepis.1